MPEPTAERGAVYGASPAYRQATLSAPGTPSVGPYSVGMPPSVIVPATEKPGIVMSRATPITGGRGQNLTLPEARTGIQLIVRVVVAVSVPAT